MPNDPEIWLQSVRLELKTGNGKIAQHLMARALQTCPEAGKLWALAIEMEPQATRMRKCTDAVSRNKNDSFIFMAIGKIFWEEQKPIKARKFLK